MALGIRGSIGLLWEEGTFLGKVKGGAGDCKRIFVIVVVVVFFVHSNWEFLAQELYMALCHNMLVLKPN